MDPVTLLAACVLGRGPAMTAGHSCPGQSQVTHVELADSVAGSNSDQSPALGRWQPFIAEAAHRFGIPEAWIRAVMRVESGGQTMLAGVPITSHAGAMGLMQVMPQTYAAMRLSYGLGNDPYAPRDNILAGTAYLREMYDRYGYPNLFAAYNAGPDTLDSHLSHGSPLPSETLGYLAAISLNVRDGMLVGRLSMPSTAANLGRSTAHSDAGISVARNLFFFVSGATPKADLVSRDVGIGPALRANSGSIIVKSGPDAPFEQPHPSNGLFVPLDGVR